MVWDLRLCRSLGRFWRRVGYHLNKIVPLHYLLVYTTICGQSSSCLLKFHFNNFELDKRKSRRISPTFLFNLILICHIRIKCIRCTNTVKRIHDKSNIGSSGPIISFRVFFRRNVIKISKLKEPLLF